MKWFWAIVVIGGVLLTPLDSAARFASIPRAAAQTVNTCEIALLEKTDTCDQLAQVQSFIDADSTVLMIDLSPRYEYQYLTFEIHYGMEPDGWTVNIGDSETNDGYAGDGGTQSNDAELQIVNTGLTVYGNSDTPADNALDGAYQLLNVPDFLAESRDVVLTVGDGYLRWDNGRGEAGTLESPYLFALNGQPDQEGSTNYTVFAAFNGVVEGQLNRIGTGATYVRLIFSTRSESPALVTPSATPASTTPPSTSRQGMTWGLANTITSLEVIKVGCTGSPPAQMESGFCNPYFGDTSCETSLPILCLRVEDRPRPDYPVSSSDSGVMSSSYYNGWSGGSVGLTEPVRGIDLRSLEHANDLCAAALGEGYRMAGHHDGDGGGWGFYTYGTVRDDTRFWAYIDDQPANCWD